MAEPAVAVYALDVGQGDCSFVVSANPADGVVLFDCNDPYVAERFVTDHKIRRIHAVIVSHLDLDHIRGILPFLKWFLSDERRTVDSVYVAPDRDTTLKQAAELFDAVLKWSDEGKFTLHRPEREEVQKMVLAAPGWTAEIVLPRYEARIATQLAGDTQPNHCSVALRVQCGTRAVLIGGDVPLVSWQRLESSLLPAVAFRCPHHGGKIHEGEPAWTEADLYDKVGPEVVLVSAGTNNRHGHPTDRHVAGIGPSRRRLLCTQLTARCHDDVPGARSEMLRQASRVTYAPYRHRYTGGTSVARPPAEVPCAGSMSVELYEDGSVHYEPERDGWHERLLDRMLLATPMCRRSATTP